MRKVESLVTGSRVLTGRNHTFSYVLPPGDGFAVGNFRFDVDSGAWNWSHGAFTIHGFEPGDVVPTMGLVLAHKHPADRDEFERIFRRVMTDGGTMVSHHRIIDGHGRTRRVIMVGQGVEDAAGRICAVDGHFIDLTRIMEAETAAGADAAVQRAVEKRHFIEQAKGILMGRHRIDAEAAFGMLAQVSQHSHRKLRDVAVDLVASVVQEGGCPELPGTPGRG
ncbi:PAS and ANTAR domain-containing protein [Arthrobacter sp. SDTb3-6]|uniref:PAS and ANTAR domain-containing protein n=1 Tax=Arthrobacter sp. SDTb3-6 TaxID=2713571 RepID=UPI00159DBEAF|nr:PAS and ANTAR domain-containing protein [Arthrobacter sp. SDTb3-6]NVM98710.1 ANTAR domain-containing protein [Arthrobacter sp. SDTb3-6]